MSLLTCVIYMQLCIDPAKRWTSARVLEWITNNWSDAAASISPWPPAHEPCAPQQQQHHIADVETTAAILQRIPVLLARVDSTPDYASPAILRCATAYISTFPTHAPDTEALYSPPREPFTHAHSEEARPVAKHAAQASWTSLARLLGTA